MEFSEKEFLELLRLLDQRPDLLQMLRQKILTDELLRLPEQVQELVQAVHRLEQIVSEHTEQLLHHSRLFEMVLESLRDLRRIAELHTEQLKEHSEQLKQHTELLKEHSEQLKQHSHQLEEIQREQKKMQDTLGMLKGFYLEEQFRRRAHAYFARIMRRLQVLSPDQVAQLADNAVDSGIISMEERNDLLDADLVARGQQDGEERYLLVEVSSVVDVNDVERAVRRAQILERIVQRSVAPAVAGEKILKKARQHALLQGAEWVQGSPKSR